MSDLTFEERREAQLNEPGWKGVAALKSMADKLAVNAGNGFGGCFVIVAPDGEIKELLMLNNSADLPMFWSLVQTAASIAIEELKDQNRQQFGRR